ncbi:TetR/AcrR family transcriptional regulator [Oerskovia enterophila]|uniref:HTH-type transcriptional regulator RcdA n=1 Tax=Oerskovia enterophila TaxID=43678 RepID=A0A163SC75_9CELL|nr:MULTISPECIES: TetR family transcriptional regulator [Oerskovia]KZM36241.1 HTH-type transcriptional regulator RcdA [Oerskovia enterophila]OCI33046.1 HTH-type transcriptional regulator RcdA [Oerskovia enterophila]
MAPESEKHVPRRQARGTQRRDRIVSAAAELILRDGPAAVTHRSVAAQADVPLAATTYYFTGLDDLLGAAGEQIVRGWAERAQAIGHSVTELVAEGGVETLSTRSRALLLVDAVLPPGDHGELLGFYEHVVSAGRSPVLAAAFAQGRGELDVVIDELLAQLGARFSAVLLIAVVDGAAVTALCEGRAVRDLAVECVTELLGGA